MLFHIVMTDIKGIRMAMDIVAKNLLDAELIAEEQYEESLKEKDEIKKEDTQNE